VYFLFLLFLSNISNFLTKSPHSLFSKKSPVTHARTVSVSHPHLYANTGFPAAITSIGTIPKSSSPGNTRPRLFWTKDTRSSQYWGPEK
jgi:hypothetical protein